MTYSNPNPYAMQDRLFAAAQAEAAHQERVLDWWDYNYPGWETREIDPEDRDTVDYSDVDDPEAGFVRRYGWDDPGRYFPGASGE